MLSSCLVTRELFSHGNLEFLCMYPAYHLLKIIHIYLKVCKKKKKESLLIQANL